jgi:periplasmic divalent cation tolerance protein
MSKLSVAYITTKNPTEARKIARDLLSKNLIACANILPNGESIYRWNTKIHSSKESYLIVKTQKKHLQKIITQVKKIHSYSAPCVICFDVQTGNPDFLKWIQSETC